MRGGGLRQGGIDARWGPGGEAQGLGGSIGGCGEKRGGACGEEEQGWDERSGGGKRRIRRGGKDAKVSGGQQRAHQYAEGGTAHHTQLHTLYPSCSLYLLTSAFCLNVFFNFEPL